MNSIFFAALLAVLTAPAFAVEADFDGRSPVLSAASAAAEGFVPAAPPAARAGDPAVREWTVMVFVNAKNNLERFGLRDVNEMELAGSTDKVAVVAELGRTAQYTAAEGGWKGARRYLITKDTDTAAINSPVLRDADYLDMGDYRSVIDFAKWAKAAYPAKKYMLVIWNHGSGWERSGAAGGRWISTDEQTGHRISTPQLAAILKEIGGVDIYASDACLMQMAEVVYELKDHASYIVGSEETEPADGQPYDRLLGALGARPEMTPEELSRAMVDVYADYYEQWKQPTTDSYIRTAALPGLLKAANAFTAALTRSRDKAAAKAAAAGAQNFNAPDNKDLYDLAELVTAKTRNADVKTAGKTLLEYLTGTLIGHSRVTHGCPKAHGLAVYLPPYEASGQYQELQWAKDSGWDEFIKWQAQ